MGKGDRKTAKGKRYNSSYGKSRPKSAGAPVFAGTAAVKKTTAAKPAAKAPAKKVVAKKAG
jgi:30S ribosomal protein S31